MTWNKAVLVFFLSPQDNLQKIQTVRSLFPPNWQWSQVICVIDDADPCNWLSVRIDLSKFRPTADTYYVVITNDARPEELATVLSRIARSGCAWRAYGLYPGGKLKECE